MSSFDAYLKDSTGSHGFETHDLKVNFEGYEIIVELGPSQEFVRIKSIAQSEDFRNIKRRIESSRGNDLSDIYGLE